MIVNLSVNTLRSDIALTIAITVGIYTGSYTSYIRLGVLRLFKYILSY
jgi:hypothetical protein